jgi:Domain of unknown function (DUF4129)
MTAVVSGERKAPSETTLVVSRSHWLPGIAVLCLGSLPLLAQSSRPSQAETRQQAQEVYAGQDFQSDLPADSRGGSGGSGSDSRKAGRPSDTHAIPAGRASPPGFSLGARGLGSLATVLLYGVLGAVLVILVSALIQSLSDRRGRTGRKAPVAPPQKAAEQPVVLADHEALARAGDFTGAVHALLLHVFAAISKRRGVPFPRATTGREILASIGGFAAADAPVASVFRTAERAWFGGREVGPEDYSGCHELFRRWQAAWSQPKN